MDSFEWNKIFGAILGTALFVVGLNIVVSGYMAPHKAAKPGMEVVVVESTGPAEAPVAEAIPDWGTVLPTADLAAGETAHKPCLMCHTFEKGGPKKQGPNLWGIVGNKHAHMEGFAYSPAMQKLAGETWDYDHLNEFLKHPKVAIPGTAMSFAGVSKVQNRINLIAYLRSLSDAPVAIPAPKPAEPAPAAPGATPADGTEPAGELQATPPGTAPATPPAAPGAATPTPGAPGAPPPPAGSATPAPAPGTSVPANPTTTAPTTTPAPTTPPTH